MTAQRPSEAAAGRRGLIFGLLLALALGCWAFSAEAIYRLPWPYCKWEKVSQEWCNNSGSHNGKQKYAYDFAMYLDEVRATNWGTVAHRRADIASNSCCSSTSCWEETNYVVLDHSDGKATLYMHLNSVSVGSGASVYRGQKVGTSGKTGYTSCGWHLHYQRQNQSDTEWWAQSVAGYFDEYYNTALEYPNYYRSLNYRYPDSTFCPWLQAPQGPPAPEEEIFAAIGVETDHGPWALPLDEAMVDLLGAEAAVQQATDETLGLRHGHPATVQPSLYAPADGFEPGWPDFLASWNLHWRVPHPAGSTVALDTQLEGYPGRTDVLEVLTRKEAERTMFDVEVISEGRGGVVVFRWWNSVARFLSVGRVDPGGVLLLHANVDAMEPPSEEVSANETTPQGAGLDKLLNNFLLPQLERAAWNGPRK